MPQIQTPLAQVLSPVRQNRFSPAATGQRERSAGQSERTNLVKQQATDEENKQRLSNLGQAATTGLNIINRDPKNAEAALREMIAHRRIINPSIGITNMDDTDALEDVLNREGVEGAQRMLQGAQDAASSSGFKLPKPTTPDFEQTFTAIGASGKPEIFFRSDQGPVPTNLIAPEKTPLVQVGAGGGNKERKAVFKDLFDESKNVDKALGQFNQLRDIVGKGGIGSIGTSGKVTKGLEKAASAIGGFVRNLGIIDQFDEGSIVAQGLANTKLGQQANTNAKISSLVTNLAFAVAQSQNKGGRITDKDFQAAVQTIGANADNPEQLLQVINQFGSNLLDQFDTDVTRTGDAFGFADNQFKALRNFPSRKRFSDGFQNSAQGGFQNNVPPVTPATLLQNITATTKPQDITAEQGQELAKSNPDLLRQIIANAKRGQ